MGAKKSTAFKSIQSGLWYLAGPFFNAPQKAWAEKIRDAAIDADYHYYAPIEHIFQDGIHDKEKANEVFQANVENLRHAMVVLCQLDWPLEDEMEIHKIDTMGHIRSGALNIPDSGTVWEMGYAAALRDSFGLLRKPRPLVIGYFSEKRDKLNLMLARSCDAFFNGEIEILNFIKTAEILDHHKFNGKEI